MTYCETGQEMRPQSLGMVARQPVTAPVLSEEDPASTVVEVKRSRSIETWSLRSSHMKRSRQEIARLLRYGHIIPISKGYTCDYVAEHYPGWTWNELVETLRAARILVQAGSMITCDERVELIQFTGPEDWEVHWCDGSVTQSAPRRSRD